MVSAFIIALAVVVIDLALKYAVSSGMTVGQSFEVIPGVLNVTYVQNTGAAFGILGQQRWIFIVVSAIMIVLLTLFLARAKGYHKLVYISAALILGGGVGNMVDRLSLGYVIDYIDFCAFPSLWRWVFNAADTAVCVGAGLLIVYLLFIDSKAYAGGMKSVLRDNNANKGNNGNNGNNGNYGDGGKSDNNVDSDNNGTPKKDRVDADNADEK